MDTIIDQEKMNLMHEILAHRYLPFYLYCPKKRDLAIKLHESGYFNNETGQATDITHKYFVDLFEANKAWLLKEVRILGENSNEVTYNEMAIELGFSLNTYYLHHFLLMLQCESKIIYKEVGDFNSALKIIFP